MASKKEKNVIQIIFGTEVHVKTPQIYQWDKGQVIKFLDVDDGVEVQFSNEKNNETKNKVIENSQVEIPGILLEENSPITAYVKLVDNNSETTIKTVYIPVKARTKPADYIEPEQEKPFRKYVEEKLENAEKLVAEANDKLKVNEECLKQIDIKTEQSVNQIAEVTNAKMGDLANTTNQQLENINTTAVSQIKAINSSAVAAGESQTKGINTVASSQISNITNVTNQQLNNINATVTHQIGIIEDKTSTQIESINNTATSQISAINSTALSQIKSINNVAQEMNLHYSEMCRNLGIDHNGIVFAETTRERPSTMYSIDVSNFKYIKFAKVVIGDFIEVTLPAEGICSIWITNLEAVETNVISDKEYDVSLISELKYYVAYPGSGHKTIVNYSLYNDEDGINGVTDLIVENALGGDY